MKSVLSYIAVGLVVAGIAGAVVINKERSLIEGLESEINKTRAEMETTAKTTSLAQVDEVANAIVQDCKVRDRYEFLLGKLDVVTATELVEVKQLHALCSNYYPAQKALLVNRLETQFESYESLISILNTIETTEPETYNLEAWRSLISKEASRSELLRKQHEIQGTIIDALASSDSENLKPLLDEAKKNADSLNVVSIQINGERDALFSI